MTVSDRRATAPATGAADAELQNMWGRVVHRRSFLRNAGLATVAATGAGAITAAGAVARGHKGSEPTPGDFAILRFLAAAELIESDIWQQYADFGGADGKNTAYQNALINLDGDMPQYISDNTDDEISHAAFINAYLRSKGQKEVNLDHFRTLTPSEATGGGEKKRLTNLMSLNVDTSWYLRYRDGGNPDFGTGYGQAVKIRNQPVIPISDTETPPVGTAPVPPMTKAQKRMQAIANSAGFHFAWIEQGGSSLYTTMCLKCTSLEVLRIVVAIGGVETNHFSLWHDKAGNAVSGSLAGVTDPISGTTFPDLNGKGEATQTNLILPEPCEFIPGLPECSVVRPTIDPLAGAVAAIHGFFSDGVFNGQSTEFRHKVMQLAKAADAAKRGV